MSLDADVIYGFGFLIEEKEARRLLKKFKVDDVGDLFYCLKGNKSPFLDLPEEIFYSATNGEYEPLEIILHHNQDLNKIIMRELPIPDFTSVLEWAKKNDVNLSNSTPELIVIPYTS